VVATYRYSRHTELVGLWCKLIMLSTCSGYSIELVDSHKWHYTLRKAHTANRTCGTTECLHHTAERATGAQGTAITDRATACTFAVVLSVLYITVIVCSIVIRR
jgi:hypothetical protein